MVDSGKLFAEKPALSGCLSVLPIRRRRRRAASVKTLGMGGSASGAVSSVQSAKVSGHVLRNRNGGTYEENERNEIIRKSTKSN